MATLLFKLNGVPDDEADAVRTLLEEARIEFYETSSGRWGISVAALWLPAEQDYDRARALIDDYQKERQRQFADLTPESWAQRLKQRPAEVLLAGLALLLILGLSVLPFLDW